MKKFPLLLMVAAVTFIAAVVLLATQTSQSFAQPPIKDEVDEPPPPKDQTYVGVKECASCHFKQYIAWKKTGHAKTFEQLTAKYEKDPKCLQCHATGYGKPTGFKDKASTPNLAGTTCEACHGPGSKHVEICKALGKKKLSPEEEKKARDSIWKMSPHGACLHCHVVQGHQPSQTPPELRKKK